MKTYKLRLGKWFHLQPLCLESKHWNQLTPENDTVLMGFHMIVITETNSNANSHVSRADYFSIDAQSGWPCSPPARSHMHRGDEADYKVQPTPLLSDSVKNVVFCLIKYSPHHTYVTNSPNESKTQKYPWPKLAVPRRQEMHVKIPYL